MELGKLIREKRNELGLTTRDLAEQSGVTNGYISMIENGKAKTPSADVLKKLSGALGIDYFMLMTLAGYYDEAFEQGFSQETGLNEKVDLFQLLIFAERGADLYYHSEKLDEDKKAFISSVLWMLLDIQLSEKDMRGILGMVEGYLKRTRENP